MTVKYANFKVTFDSTKDSINNVHVLKVIDKIRKALIVKNSDCYKKQTDFSSKPLFFMHAQNSIILFNFQVYSNLLALLTL